MNYVEVIIDYLFSVSLLVGFESERKFEILYNYLLQNF